MNERILIVEDDDAIATGATAEELSRAVAYAAALRITRFHTQNDHGDWDEVHHAFTAANALHQAICRGASANLLRGVYHNALRIYLDRFLNVPPARLPGRTTDAATAARSPPRRPSVRAAQSGARARAYDRRKASAASRPPSTRRPPMSARAVAVATTTSMASNDVAP